LNTEFSHYIEVAVALPVEQTFVYGVPESLYSPDLTGRRVLAPFGRRRVTGFVLGPGINENGHKIKNILDILDPQPLFPAAMIPFFRWIADYYLHPIGQVIKTALPSGLTLCDRAVFSLTDAGKAASSLASLTPVESRILSCLAECGSCGMKELKGFTDQAALNTLIQRLERRGWIARENKLDGETTRVKTERYVSLKPDMSPPERISDQRRRILEMLQSHAELSVRELKDHVPGAASVLRSMSEQGLVAIYDKNVYRDPFGETIAADDPFPLTPEQSHVVAAVMESLGKGFAAFLLAGVTGSGKTEVYMHLADAVIQEGLSVLVLVPEIALISQMEHRFRARFGDRVAVLHSALSGGERFDQWRRVLNQEARIVIGARSAIFAPFERIGLIIVDEEHDTSYKQGSDLLYNARDLAVVRAKLLNAVVLMGSATPSVHSYHNARIGKFKELTLSRRVEKRPLPRIAVVDLRKNRDVRGARRFISPELHQAIGETLDQGQQILLFLNRRGFASFPVCADCGQPIRCAHCDITLTLHLLTDRYQCHYCGYTRPAPGQCGACASPHIKLLGLGTEKVESSIKALFPAARVARMDRDTTRHKGSVVKILKALRSGAIDVLVGTQMIAKGHDFPNITLVGIICADLSLSFPDFRAGERTFQVLAQVAGRAGRGDVPGRVILQTYAPDHFSILAAQKQDFRAFYQTEIGFRRALNYPPFSRMVQLKISGRDKEKTHEAAQHMGMLAREIRGPDAEIEILGPIEASIYRIADHYRWQMIAKGPHASLRPFLRRLTAEHGLFNKPQVRIVIDVDPFFMA
jgi:primosomal protein N' (replication factor Y)